jgi:hypothetical protein
MTSETGPRSFLFRHRGNIATLGVVLLFALVASSILGHYGWQKGWRILGVATREVPWLDLKVIPAAVQTRAEGGDPYVANPHDPLGRTFNYPSLWLRFFPANLTPASASGVALAFATAALATVLTWTNSFRWRRGAFVGILLISPALLLAVERGNTDLAMFALTGCSLRAVTTQHRPLGYLGVLGLLLACVLKLVPAVALIVVAVLGPVHVRRMAQSALLLFIAWVAWHWSEIALVMNNTQIGAMHSYGRTVLPFAFEILARVHEQVVDLAPLYRFMDVLAAAILVVMTWLGFKVARGTPASDEISASEIAGLSATGIYVLTFLAGSSFSYRLWFLLLALPWLTQKAQPSDPMARWARIALGSFVGLLFASPLWWFPLLWLAQAASWLLFAALVALLAHRLAPFVIGFLRRIRRVPAHG